MKRHSIILFLLLAIAACTDSKQPDTAEVEQTAAGVVIQQDSSKAPQVIRPVQKKMKWTDSLIVQYIKHTDNQFVAMTRKDSARIEWMLDRREHTDTADYLIYQVSHSFEHHTVTDAWLYIDSLTKTVYEYDVAADSLIKWVK